MRHIARFSLAFTAAALTLAMPAFATPTDSGQPVKAGDLHIDRYAMRATLGNLTTTAVYVSVTNAGHTDERLTGASCDCAGMAMLHRTTHTQGMNGMAGMTGMAEADNGFVIKPGATLRLVPNGDHIMLMGVKHTLKPGMTETVKLQFAHTGTVTLKVPVTQTPLGSGAM